MLQQFTRLSLLPLFLRFVSAKETLQTATLEALEVGCGGTDGDNVVARVCEENEEWKGFILLSNTGGP